MTTDTTTRATVRRVASVLDTETGPGMGPGHTVRPVLPPGRWTEFDPFLALMEDWFVPGIFGPHPHRGFETVTFVLEGELRHEDNHGGRGILRAGDAQLMTAGRGIIHAEDPTGEPVHSLQLWLNLPARLKMTEPRYQDLAAGQMPVRREPGVEARVYSGRSGDAVAPAKNHVPLTLVDIRLEAGATLAHEQPAGDAAFLYVLEGSVRAGAGETPAAAGQVVWLERAGPGAAPDESSTIVVRADAPARVLLYAAPPLGEPVAARGPFVMNTIEQITQAYADYRAGRF